MRGMIAKGEGWPRQLYWGDEIEDKNVDNMSIPSAYDMWTMTSS